MAKDTKEKGKTTKTRVEPEIAVGSIEGFSPPAKPPRASGGGATKYPFDDLEVGGYFSVKNKNRRQMAGPLSSANKRWRNEAKDADGNVVSVQQEREFYSVDVDATTAQTLKGTPHEGASVLLVRSK